MGLRECEIGDLRSRIQEVEGCQTPRDGGRRSRTVMSGGCNACIGWRFFIILFCKGMTGGNGVHDMVIPLLGRQEASEARWIAKALFSSSGYVRYGY